MIYQIIDRSLDLIVNGYNTYSEARYYFLLKYNTHQYYIYDTITGKKYFFSLD